MLEDSAVSYLHDSPSVKAETFNHQGDKIYDFVNLVSGLPFTGVPAEANTSFTHFFELPDCILQVAEFRLPVSGIKLNYFWSSRRLSGEDLGESLGELFFGCAFK